MNKLYKFLVVLSFLLVGFSVFYYLVIYIPNKDNQIAESERLQSLQSELRVGTEQHSLNSCLTLATQLEQKDWDSECTSNGLSNNCQLSQNIADALLKSYNNNQGYCYKAFPVR